jgi:hypothetical protein
VIELTVEFYNVLSRTLDKVTIMADPWETVGNFLKRQGKGGEIADGVYFPILDVSTTFGHCLPYVIRDGVAVWSPVYDDISINELVHTLGLRSRPLRVNVSVPQAGGPDFGDAVHIWRLFYSALDVAGTIFGVVAGLDWLSKRGRQRLPPEVPAQLRRVYPGAVFSLILMQNRWDSHELARMCQISEKDARKLLELCRYKRIKPGDEYRRTRKTSAVAARLMKLDQYSE